MGGSIWYTTRRRRSVPPWGTHGPGGVRFPYFFPLEWQVTRVSPYVRGPFPSKEIRRISETDDPGRCTRGSGDQFGIPNPRKSGSVIGADWQRSGPWCVLLKLVPQGRTESGGIVLAANAGPRVPSGGVTTRDVNPLGWLAYERTACGRGLGGQMTYIV